MSKVLLVLSTDFDAKLIGDCLRGRRDLLFVNRKCAKAAGCASEYITDIDYIKERIEDRSLNVSDVVYTDSIILDDELLMFFNYLCKQGVEVSKLFLHKSNDISFKCARRAIEETPRNTKEKFLLNRGGVVTNNFEDTILSVATLMCHIPTIVLTDELYREVLLSDNYFVELIDGEKVTIPYGMSTDKDSFESIKLYRIIGHGIIGHGHQWLLQDIIQAVASRGEDFIEALLPATSSELISLIRAEDEKKIVEGKAYDIDGKLYTYQGLQKVREELPDEAMVLIREAILLSRKRSENSESGRLLIVNESGAVMKSIPQALAHYSSCRNPNRFLVVIEGNETVAVLKSEEQVRCLTAVVQYLSGKNS